MKLTDLSPEVFDELGATKERLKFISQCSDMAYYDTETNRSYLMVTHDRLDLLISNTKDLVLDIIKEWLDEEDAVKYFGTIKKIVHDRIERDFP